jgi:hypothetical protein
MPRIGRAPDQHTFGPRADARGLALWGGAVLTPSRCVSVSVGTVQSMDSIEAVTPAGAPVSFIRGGRTWRVGEDSVRWFERVDWWTASQRMQRGHRARIDVEVWR